jgi:hypothetical protein
MCGERGCTVQAEPAQGYCRCRSECAYNVLYTMYRSGKLVIQEHVDFAENETEDGQVYSRGEFVGAIRALRLLRSEALLKGKRTPYFVGYESSTVSKFVTRLFGTQEAFD